MINARFQPVCRRRFSPNSRRAQLIRHTRPPSNFGTRKHKSRGAQSTAATQHAARYTILYNIYLLAKRFVALRCVRDNIARDDGSERTPCHHTPIVGFPTERFVIVTSAFRFSFSFLHKRICFPSGMVFDFCFSPFPDCVIDKNKKN